MQKTTYYLCLALLWIHWGCKQDIPKQAEEVKIPRSLPLKAMSTNTLDAFNVEGNNWQIFGEVYADINENQAIEPVGGRGVLVNMQTEEDKFNLFSKLEHGDLEFEVEFLVPKGSNSGIYFQSRYEIQILDSWGKEEPQFSDCGGIYQRWDENRPEGKKGYEGHAPAINASRAPGLWQHFRVIFKAPRFDETGNKITNARFDSVYHNGMLIHHDVEVTGPTRAAAFEDEVPLAPIMIQGDHGKVAFRNLKYKAFGQDSMKISNLRYTLYEHDTDQLPEDFDSLKVIKEGEAEAFNVADLSTKNDYYAVKYTGEIDVPTDGEYLFETYIDDGGDLSIDGNLVVHNIGDPGGDDARGLVKLTKGIHQIEMTFHQVVWSAIIIVFYEGPGIPKRPLASIDPRRQYRTLTPILVNPTEEPEMIRGFVKYGQEKRTHAISVGDPAGIHYSYDLLEGALLKFWRGDFADVTDMWGGRGIEQLLKPLEASVEANAGVPLAFATDGKSYWQPVDPAGFQYKGHKMNEEGRPVFQYTYAGMGIQDELGPGEDGKSLHRTISITGASAEGDAYYRIAEGRDIQLLPNGLFRVNGAYYVSFDEATGIKAEIREADGQKILAMPLEGDGFGYEVIW